VAVGSARAVRAVAGLPGLGTPAGQPGGHGAGGLARLLAVGGSAGKQAAITEGRTPLLLRGERGTVVQGARLLGLVAGVIRGDKSRFPTPSRANASQTMADRAMQTYRVQKTPF